jgi:hypothetical protein
MRMRSGAEIARYDRTACSIAGHRANEWAGCASCSKLIVPPIDTTMRQKHSARGIHTEIVYKPLPKDDPRRRRPDISRARQVLDWSPKVDLAIGLRSTIDYFQGEIEKGNMLNLCYA